MVLGWSSGFSRLKPELQRQTEALPETPFSGIATPCRWDSSDFVSRDEAGNECPGASAAAAATWADSLPHPSDTPLPKVDSVAKPRRALDVPASGSTDPGQGHRERHSPPTAAVLLPMLVTPAKRALLARVPHRVPSCAQVPAPPSRGNSPRRAEADRGTPVRRRLRPDTVGRADGPRCVEERAATQHTLICAYNIQSIFYIVY